MAQEFGGDQASFLLKDTALQELSDMTGSQALRQGVEPALVWQAICIQLSVPKTRWHGMPTKTTHIE